MKTIKRTVKTVWTWKDDYCLEISAKDPSELFALLNHFEGQRLPNERTMECASMLRSELARRDGQGEMMLQQAGLA